MKKIEEYLYTDYIRESLNNSISYSVFLNDTINPIIKKRKSKIKILKQIIRIKLKKLFY